MSGFDEIVREWQEACGAPAASVAVLRHGALIHAAGYGEGGLERLYQSASVGKHLTAALALVLVESGEWESLDTPVARTLAELPPEWGSITMRHLLSHTSGIPALGYESLDLARDYTDEEIVRAIASGGATEFAPGAGWSYSNAGYVLAGIALGRAAGKFYGELLRERIFLPVGMTSAGVTPPDPPQGYYRENGRLVAAEFVSPTLNRVADGGLSLSIMDFARWESALWGEWGVRLAEMFRDTRLADGSSCGYGLGWFVSVNERGRVAEHDGAWQGFSTAMVRYLDAGISTVVLANVGDAGALELAHALAAAV